MKTYYFVAGKFNMTGSGIFSYNYCRDRIGIICKAETFSDAQQKVIDFCTNHFNAPYKDINESSGELFKPWHFTPLTPWVYHNDISYKNKTDEFDI